MLLHKQRVRLNENIDIVRRSKYMHDSLTMKMTCSLTTEYDLFVVNSNQMKVVKVSLICS